LLAAVGAVHAAARVSARPFWFHGRRVWADGVTLLVPGSLFGADAGPVALRTQVYGSAASDGVAMPGARRTVGVERALGSPVVAGVPVSPTWISRDESLSRAEPTGALGGALGYDALYATDLAVSAGTREIAVGTLTSVNVADPGPFTLERARERFAATASDDASATGPGEVARHQALAAALWTAGLVDEALEHDVIAVAAAGEGCAADLVLGSHLLAAGRPDEALAPLQRAAQRWDRWSLQDLAVRQRLQQGRPVPDSSLVDQPASCHVAWSRVAAAQLALGEHAAVAEVYDAHVDLDPDLPLAYGVSLLARGRPAEADGPLRQALNLGARLDPAVWAALALAQPEVAGPSARLLGLPGEPTLATGWFLVEAARRRDGDAGAERVARALVDLDPLSVPAHLLATLASPGDEAVREGLDAALIAFRFRTPHTELDLAFTAVARALDGDAAGARGAVGGLPIAMAQESAVAQLLVAQILDDPDLERASSALRRRFPLYAVHERPLMDFDHTHATFDAFLDGAVAPDGVRYDVLATRRPALAAYLEALATAPVASFAPDQQLAFWIDAYNALTLALVLDAMPLSSIRELDGGQVWTTRSFVVGGERLTLDAIERERVRPLGDGRVHAVLSCASRGCPPLSPDAVVASGLDAQLDAAAARWVASNAWQSADGGVALSSIFDWYAADFAAYVQGDIPGVDGDAEAALWFLSRYADTATSARLRAGGAPVVWQEYDWSLNER
jgi:tetratricopeptide (TPR) repeat protein